MKNAEPCLACEILKGRITPPGGVIYQNDCWHLDHAMPPILIPGLLILKLKRHRAHLADLNLEETQSLGPTIQKVSHAVQQVTHADKIHVASYGERVRHVHFLITPRTSDLPASNIRLTFWLLWRRSLYRLGWQRLASDPETVIPVVKQLRIALQAVDPFHPSSN